MAPDLNQAFAALALEPISQVEERAEKRRPIVAGEIDQASLFGDRARR
jgi:hypothetical protein